MVRGTSWENTPVACRRNVHVRARVCARRRKGAGLAHRSDLIFGNDCPLNSFKGVLWNGARGVYSTFQNTKSGVASTDIESVLPCLVTEIIVAIIQRTKTISLIVDRDSQSRIRINYIQRVAKNDGDCKLVASEKFKFFVFVFRHLEQRQILLKLKYLLLARAFAQRNLIINITTQLHIKNRGRWAVVGNGNSNKSYHLPRECPSTHHVSCKRRGSFRLSCLTGGRNCGGSILPCNLASDGMWKPQKRIREWWKRCT